MPGRSERDVSSRRIELNDDEVLLKHLYRRLHEEPLRLFEPEERDLYIKRYDALETDGDPVERLGKNVLFKEQESLQ
ncbi:MAG TPA: hypothetical protein PKE31_21630 [Pseudomonadota bacterium]|nr:hypothetical protein [Pseudomonadota bacterium]